MPPQPWPPLQHLGTPEWQDRLLSPARLSSVVPAKAKIRPCISAPPLWDVRAYREESILAECGSAAHCAPPFRICVRRPASVLVNHGAEAYLSNRPFFRLLFLIVDNSLLLFTEVFGARRVSTVRAQARQDSSCGVQFLYRRVLMETSEPEPWEGEGGAASVRRSSERARRMGSPR